MKIASKLSLYFLCVLALSWFLPWLVSLMTPAQPKEPYLAWSPISNNWVASITNEDKSLDIFSIDADGNRDNSYTRDQRDSLLPQLYFRNLKTVPAILANETAHSLRAAEMNFNSNPRDINKNQVGVWLMMESDPERGTLEDPEEVFRFTSDGGMEFVDMATNEVNAERSEAFTNAIKKAGFKAPATHLNANITARKNYDEGYMMVDSEGKAFHVKQKQGRPVVRPITLPNDAKAANAYIFENTDQTLIGFVVDTDGNSYLIERNNYKPVMLEGIAKVYPSVDRINMMGNLLNIVFRFQGPDGTRWSAIDRQTYQTLGTYTYEKPAVNSAADYLFTYRMTLTSLNDCYIYPRITGWSTMALPLNGVLAVLLVIIMRRRRQSVKTALPLALCTIFFGLYLFIPAWLIKD